MKVVRLKFRTPGIYLKDPVELKIELTPEGTENWRNIEDIPDITVLADSTRPDVNGKGIFEGEVETQPLRVPPSGQPERVVDLLMKDGQRWKYRILALGCFNCAQIFRDKVITDPAYPKWTVIAGQGIVES